MSDVCETCGCPAEVHQPDSIHPIVWCGSCGASTCQETPVPSGPRVIPDPVTFLCGRHAWLERLLGRPA